jgi:hypothetical protein
MEHVIALSHATTKFIEVGEEFTGTPSSKYVPESVCGSFRWRYSSLTRIVSMV